MKANEIAVKVAVGAITAMAAGVGSILGSEGAKAGIKALMEHKKNDENIDAIPANDAVTELTAANDAFVETAPEDVIEETGIESEVEGA